MIDEDDLERLFDRWRDWSYLNNYGLGYKKITTEHRLMVEGIVIRTRGGEVLEDLECEALDAVLAKLPKNIKKAIKLKYLWGWRNRDAASVMKLSVATFKRNMARYRRIVLLRLNA